MKEILSIIGIAAGVVGLAVVIWLIRLMRDKRELERAARRRKGYPSTPEERAAYAEMQELRHKYGDKKS